ncbi:ATP cone domain-containing protein [Anaerococcus sp. ENR1011]|uniref:ATP cone domain-containing protein n=1 Tax=Anaerococcus groningensis TaxID=3115616 RepID=A0ABW9N1Q5_9FIRM
MSELSRRLLEEFESQGYGINEIAREIDKLKIEVVRDFLKKSDDDTVYVIKRSGNLEEYNSDKVTRSIKNAADRNDKQLNSSDVEILIKDIEKSMQEMDRKVFRTDEIKEYVKNALVSEGYSQIYDSYVSYIQAQN